MKRRFQNVAPIAKGIMKLSFHEKYIRVGFLFQVGVPCSVIIIVVDVKKGPHIILLHVTPM